jgi:hypothetical protein
MTDARPSLLTFTLAELAQFTKEGAFATDASVDFHLFYVGRDDVHGILTYLWSRVTVSAYLNMFGYDDEELNDLVMAVAEDPLATAVYTLDKSQAGGAHEKRILASDAVKDPIAYKSHFAIGRSATHQISHTEGGVLDGRVGFEGSTNWSASGEGTYIAGLITPGGPGVQGAEQHARGLHRLRHLRSVHPELIAEHLIAVAQGGTLEPDKAKPAKAPAR